MCSPHVRAAVRKIARSSSYWKLRLYAGRAFQWLEQTNVIKLRLSPKASIPFTYLFRDVEDYRDAIMSYFARQPHELRILCVGCATGQEAYSIAILCHDQGIPVAVVGVDLSSNAIEEAKAGIYILEVEKERSRSPDTLDSERWIDRYATHYFTPVDPTSNKYKVRNDIRNTVSFYTIDICDIDFQHVFDFVVCRKMLYYLPARSRLTAVRKMKAALKPGLSDDHILFDSYTKRQSFFSALLRELKI